MIQDTELRLLLIQGTVNNILACLIEFFEAYHLDYIEKMETKSVSTVSANNNNDSVINKILSYNIQSSICIMLFR